jgi:cytochrome oxidase Cu insertion factor (SCO1/SenC/PrrC family)
MWSSGEYGMKRLPLAVLSVLVLLGVVAVGAFWRSGDLPSQSETLRSQSEADSQSETQTQDTQPSEFGGSFSLTDQYGMRRTDMDFRGKYMLIFFGYTYCPDVCPTTLAIEAEAFDKLGARASRIVPIFISVDPKRDTPDKLKSYLSSFDAKQPSTRPSFVGLTGTEEEIAKAAKAYRVYYRAHIDGRAQDGADYSIDHTGDVYLMDPEGKFVAYYSQGILPDEMAADLMSKTSPG